MKIVVFGPTGMIGSEIVTELERRGVDITDASAVAEAVHGQDGVVCAISARGVDYTLSDVAHSLTEGMRSGAVRRLIVVGGAGSLEVAPGVRLVDSPDFPEAYAAEARQAADALGVFREVDDLDWTYVSPAALIHPGKRTGSYRLGRDQLLVDAAGNSEISAEDFAIAIADLADSGAHPQERVTAAW
jgi:putative NADH-flavin reductase